MRYSPTQFAIFPLCLAVAAAVGAGDPRSLTRACPKLAPIDGLPAGSTVIDNQTVLRLAEQGRIAAVSNRPEPVLSTGGAEPKVLASTKNRWRSEHKKSVNVLHGFKKQLSKAQSEHEALKSQYFAASNGAQRARLRPKLDAKASQVNQLKEKQQSAMESFSGLIRRARLDGAQPGWFRDLPRP